MTPAHSDIVRNVIGTLQVALADLGDPPDAGEDPVGAMLDARPDLARELRDRVLGPVLTREDRDLLLDALAAWLAAGGSAARAAAALYCHRNTVLNRVRRLERLTNKSLSATSDLVELALACRVHQSRVVTR